VGVKRVLELIPSYRESKVIRSWMIRYVVAQVIGLTIAIYLLVLLKLRKRG